ncbi:hypothetical protein MTYP_03232 [Methylophilaceae bacterium]|nr:hypothetical protein MTYP_03232 [Methylophilaceae bacterium]
MVTNAGKRGGKVGYIKFYSSQATGWGHAIAILRDGVPGYRLPASGKGIDQAEPGAGSDDCGR